MLNEQCVFIFSQDCYLNQWIIIRSCLMLLLARYIQTAAFLSGFLIPHEMAHSSVWNISTFQICPTFSIIDLVKHFFDYLFKVKCNLGYNIIDIHQINSFILHIKMFGVLLTFGITYCKWKGPSEVDFRLLALQLSVLVLPVFS